MNVQWTQTENNKHAIKHVARVYLGLLQLFYTIVLKYAQKGQIKSRQLTDIQKYCKTSSMMHTPD